MNGDANDKILIHGIIDGYIELEDHIVLFDYKTDRVSPYGAQAGEKMLEKYKGQLNLYRSALESILDKKLLKRIFVYLKQERSYPFHHKKHSVVFLSLRKELSREN